MIISLSLFRGSVFVNRKTRPRLERNGRGAISGSGKRVGSERRVKKQQTACTTTSNKQRETGYDENRVPMGGCSGVVGRSVVGTAVEGGEEKGRERESGLG